MEKLKLSRNCNTFTCCACGNGWNSFFIYKSMMHIKLPERLEYPSPEEKRNFITSDETWAFTEHPRIELSANDPQKVTVYDLFNYFTADIIRKNTVFTR